ncbi:MAG TPA: glycosyltransferase family 2 protein [Anaerolineae bacterium]|nr:glycosyltransferase family 2 protein [Anaerolineae bacterium]HOQ98495.1 glycosyltransferase family 2 protein [Anaerolineae bacterium]HPL30231.1 glycosyltransferase family 2 protein [Anaerolineae bacterium]
MKLSVLVPVYNEEAGVAEVIRRVAAILVDKEIIVVDDCSTDRTPEILAELQREIPGLRVIRHPVNRGKGAGIRTAMEAATGDCLIIQDADLEYDPADIPNLLRLVEEGTAKVVYGVRSFEGQKLHVRLGNRFLTWLTNLLYGVHIHDMETCYKLMAAEVARGLSIECRRFDMEPEITAKIARRGYTIHEVPIAYKPRRAKKLSPWRDGLPALRALWRYRRWSG